jgi:hypothetical protein
MISISYFSNTLAIVFKSNKFHKFCVSTCFARNKDGLEQNYLDWIDWVSQSTWPFIFTRKNARALQREGKSYQMLIENKGRMLYIYLCFTLSINFKSIFYLMMTT